jgi:hypothetical protein
MEMTDAIGVLDLSGLAPPASVPLAHLETIAPGFPAG